MKQIDDAIKEQERLRDTLERFVDDFLPTLDCDGCTRFVSFLLKEKRIDFDIFTGKVIERGNPRNTFPVHYWIVTKEGIIFDFKTKKWLGIKSDKVIYPDKTKINKNDFLSVGGSSKELLLGVLLILGLKSDRECFDILTTESLKKYA